MKTTFLFVARFIAIALAIAVLYGFQNTLFTHLNGYYQVIVLNAGIAVILAVSLNLVNGITGQFSLGHAGFAAIGAYGSAYFTKEIGGQLLDPLSFILGITLGAVLAGIAGLLVGLPSLRLRGDYLAIVTLGFNQIIISIIRNLEVVGGAAGYSDIPLYTTFAWVWGLALLCILSIRNLAVSELGRSMRAIRDDEIAAEAAGINTTRIKVLSFVYSAMWAGVAGALQVHFLQSATPEGFTFVQSIEVVVSVVLGGLGSITGSALAGMGLTILQEALREVPGAFYTGVVLVFVSFYWNFTKLRAEKQLNRASLVRGIIIPAVSLALLLGLYFYPSARTFLESNKSALRYVIYSLILIVVMLLRPQGLLGRREWSFAGLQRAFNLGSGRDPRING
ncbi:branched-chain amino acid ABC transporter permease [bacterium]|nr:MAG: branched-chain amino acid ABC transporter permease [bacterium]